MTLEAARDRFDSPTISAVVLLALLWTILNLPYEYVSTANQFYPPPQEVEFTFETFAFPNYEIRHGGFPLCYLIGEPDDTNGVQFWSPGRLAVNGLLAILSTAAIGWIVLGISRRQKVLSAHKSISAGSISGPRSALAFRLLVIGGLSSVLVLIVVYRLMGERSDRHLARQLARAGGVHVYALAPRPIAKFLPTPILARFAKIRGVTSWDRNPQSILKIASIPTLHSLALVGVVPDNQSLSLLADAAQLRMLRLHRVKVNETTKQTIAGLVHLRKLQFTGCKGLSQELPNLEKMDRLQDLKLTDSDTQLSSLSRVTWPETIKRLSLPRPAGGSDTLTLENMPALESLIVARSNATLNPDTVELQLRNLPKLEYLGIETYQKYALQISSAPRLRSVGYVEHDLIMRASIEDLVPMALWFESLRLDGLPSLQEFFLDGMDLNVIELNGLPNLERLAIGRYGYGNGINLRKNHDRSIDRMQSLINSLGKCDIPPLLDLSSLPLAGVDMSPLADSRRLQQLSLVDCGIEGSQLAALTKIPRLVNLDLRGCAITDNEALGLLRSGLLLNELLVNSDKFEKIEVVKLPQLCGYVSTESRLVKSVHISESPQLSVELLLGNCVKQLSIRDGHSLRGLSVDGPLPPDSEVKGLRNLAYFAVGGPRADDELCSNLWQCSDLDHLTIAYGQLSRKSLKNIGLLSKLTVLSVPGSDIDDELVMNHWTPLQRLSNVNLNHTNISSNTVDFLIKLKNIQRIAINHCDVAAADLRKLGEIDQLIELEVSGIGLEVDTLIACLKRGMLDRLDLSHSELTEDMIEVLAGPTANSLVFLGLQNCKLKSDQLKRIVESHPNLAFDVSGNDIGQDLIGQLRSQQRLLDHHDRDGFLRRLSNGELQRMTDIRAEFDSIRGRINDQQFYVDAKPLAAVN